jgi:hypothetical protein
MITLTPQARAISAFTLAVLLVLGDLNKTVLGIVLLFGTSYPDGRVGQLLTNVMLIAIAAAVTWFAVTTVAAGGAGTGWDSHVARAAVLVGAVGLAITVMIGIGSVANNDTGVPGGTFSTGLFF